METAYCDPHNWFDSLSYNPKCYSYEKFGEGGWVTLLITSAVTGLCYLIRRHYTKVRDSVRHLEETLSNIPATEPFKNDPVDSKAMTAILLVSSFNGFGLHTLLSIVQHFPGIYKNFIFLSVAEVDSGSFKGVAEIEALQVSVKQDLEKSPGFMAFLLTTGRKSLQMWLIQLQT